jgi:hypothetical protein
MGQASGRLSGAGFSSAIYWRPDYLRDKYAKLQAAKLENFILCIDRKNLCGSLDEWALPGAHLIEFSGHVDAAKLLSCIRTNLQPS